MRFVSIFSIIAALILSAFHPTAFASPADGSALHCARILMGADVMASGPGVRVEENLVAYLNDLLKSNTIEREEIETFRNELQGGRKINFLEDSISMERVVAEPIVSDLINQSTNLEYLIHRLNLILSEHEEVTESAQVADSEIATTSYSFRIATVEDANEFGKLIEEANLNITSSVEREVVARYIVSKHIEEFFDVRKVSRKVAAYLKTLPHDALAGIIEYILNTDSPSSRLIDAILAEDTGDFFENHLDLFDEMLFGPASNRISIAPGTLRLSKVPYVFTRGSFVKKYPQIIEAGINRIQHDSMFEFIYSNERSQEDTIANNTSESLSSLGFVFRSTFVENLDLFSKVINRFDHKQISTLAHWLFSAQGTKSELLPILQIGILDQVSKRFREGFIRDIYIGVLESFHDIAIGKRNVDSELWVNNDDGMARNQIPSFILQYDLPNYFEHYPEVALYLFKVAKEYELISARRNFKTSFPWQAAQVKHLQKLSLQELRAYIIKKYNLSGSGISEAVPEVVRR